MLHYVHIDYDTDCSSDIFGTFKFHIRAFNLHRSQKKFYEHKRTKCTVFEL